jgi:ABC-type sugar transport system substrate-binding protein
MAPKYLRQLFEQPRLRTSISIATVVGGTLLAAAVISPAMTAEAVKQGLKLAFFCSGGDNDYQLTGIRAAKETAAKYGASVQYYDAHFDTAKQLN